MLSGGYQKTNAEVIANSIMNLDRKFHIINPKTSNNNNNNSNNNNNNNNNNN
jgi:hypothetical protein